MIYTDFDPVNVYYMCPNRSAPRLKRRFATPLPYSSFAKSASCMSMQDLRVAQVGALRNLRAPRNYWRNHIEALIRYGIAMSQEYVGRGGSDAFLREFKLHYTPKEWHKPNWAYDLTWHNQSKAYLLYLEYGRQCYKAFNFYNSQFCGPAVSLRAQLRDMFGRSQIRTCNYSQLRMIKDYLCSRCISSQGVEVFFEYTHYIDFVNEGIGPDHRLTPRRA